MSISTRGRYGLRALLDLAAQKAGKPVPLSDIAQRQAISEGYLAVSYTHLDVYKRQNKGSSVKRNRRLHFFIREDGNARFQCTPYLFKNSGRVTSSCRRAAY